MSKLISQPSTLICVLSEHPPCPRKTVKTSSFYIVFHTERSWRAKRAEDTMIARRRQSTETTESFNSHTDCTDYTDFLFSDGKLFDLAETS